MFDDLRHSTKQNRLDYRLGPDTFAYQGLFAYARLFDRLEAGGYSTHSLDEPLTPDGLDGFETLFINLVSEDLPDFDAEELDAVAAFVEHGGGLVLIADHSNAYGHAERINRLLAPSGLAAMLHTAVENDPDATVEGTGWLLVSAFAEHPVTKEIRAISLQTGGPIWGGTGLAFTSEDSFADLWNPNDPNGHYGNWTHDGDEAVEPRGPLSVVSVAEWGRGRVVVIGDQNIFGDAWLYFADNFTLAANAFDWVTHREDAPLRAVPSTKLSIGLDQRSAPRAAGRTDPSGFYGFFVALNRHAEVEAHARFELGEDRITILTEPSVGLDDAAVQKVRGRLRAGGDLWVLGETPAARQLLFALDSTYPGSDSGGELRSTHLTSSVLDVDDLELTTSVLRLSWGSSLISGDGFDVAREASVLGGRVVVFPSARPFINATLGDPGKEPAGEARQAHALVGRLVAWAATR